MLAKELPHLKPEVAMLVALTVDVGELLILTYANQHAERWGREWIILPNPMYGSWEASLYGFDYALPRDEHLKLKQRHLAE